MSKETICKKAEEFKTVKFFREVKEQISKDTFNMTFDELREYINKRKIKTTPDAKHTTTTKLQAE
jgi:hypothetical protein